MSNQMMAQQPQQMKFSDMISTKGYQAMLNKSLRDPARINRFVASITSAVATNTELQKCDPSTVLSAALLGESLKLSPSPQLGQFYMVPFKNKAKYEKDGTMIKPETTDAQFVLGYKGYIQLALRSGYYKHLNVMSVKAGELISWDPLTEEISLNLIQDDTEREAAPTIGYVAMFEYLNGFSKTIYWSREKMVSHADKYSPAFSAKATTGKCPKVSFDDYCAGNYPKSDSWKYSSFWYKDFDGMAFKTMLRQLISKWGVMSIDLQKAYEAENEYMEDDPTAAPVDDPIPTTRIPEVPHEEHPLVAEYPDGQDGEETVDFNAL